MHTNDAQFLNVVLQRLLFHNAQCKQHKMFNDSKAPGKSHLIMFAVKDWGHSDGRSLL